VRDVREFMAAFRDNAPTQETTNMLAAFRMGFSRHLSDGQKTLFIVMTDGSPNAGQEEKIEELIYRCVSTRDPNGECVNVFFIRMGDDEGAVEFLQRMDDCIQIGENVDTKCTQHNPTQTLFSDFSSSLSLLFIFLKGIL
jgi:hypothetical protein